MGSGEMKAGSRWFWVAVVISAACVAVISAEKSDLDTPEQVQKFSIASCNFTLNILKQIENNHDSNIVFSPASIGILLAVLQQGATGNTLQELDKLLQLKAEETKEGFGKLTLFKEEEKVQLKWGNQCFVKKGTHLQNDFQKTVKDNFGLGVEEIDFETLPQDVIVTKINKWVRMATEGKIVDLVDSSMVSPNTIMLLINAIFFKGNWLRPFKKSKTGKELFETSENSSVEAFFMTQREKFYSEKDTSLGAKWVQMPFENDRFSMIFILPTKKHQLTQLIRKLSGEDLHTIFSRRGVSNVKVRIPKFKLSGRLSLVETLQELGLKDAFSQGCDLRGMASENVPVSDMIHQANIEIDEKGSTSTAATVIQFLRMGTPNLTFTANQPFLFFLLDVQKNIPLFAGKVSNPMV